MGKGKISTVYKVRGIKGEIVSRTPWRIRIILIQRDHRLTAVLALRFR